MAAYTVRFERGSRNWTCSVFPLSADGRIAGDAVASGAGATRDSARDTALSLAGDPDVRAALAGTDHTRPYWTQGPLGEALEAQRRAAEARKAPRPTRPRRS